MPSASSFYYHTDHQGSVRALTSDGGQVVNSYAYDSYGTALESVESLAQRFRYTGREFDALTGLYHYRARAYDPETARFLQEDPLGFDAGDLNVYRYVGSNPMNWTDPSGMTNSGYLQVTTMSAGALTAGQMATNAMFATAAGTAAYLAIEATKRNALSSTSGTISCTFFTLADAVGAAGLSRIVGIDETACGAIERRTQDPPYVPPPVPDDDADDGDPCWEQLQNDLHQCKFLSAGRGGGYLTKSGRIWFKACEAIANTRYAECRAGKPLSPFPIWKM